MQSSRPPSTRLNRLFFLQVFSCFRVEVLENCFLGRLQKGLRKLRQLPASGGTPASSTEQKTRPPMKSKEQAAHELTHLRSDRKGDYIDGEKTSRNGGMFIHHHLCWKKHEEMEAFSLLFPPL